MPIILKARLLSSWVACSTLLLHSLKSLRLEVSQILSSLLDIFVIPTVFVLMLNLIGLILIFLQLRLLQRLHTLHELLNSLMHIGLAQLGSFLWFVTNERVNASDDLGLLLVQLIRFDFVKPWLASMQSSIRWEANSLFATARISGIICSYLPTFDP